jgi:hypothetical protein
MSQTMITLRNSAIQMNNNCKSIINVYIISVDSVQLDLMPFLWNFTEKFLLLEENLNLNSVISKISKSNFKTFTFFY